MTKLRVFAKRLGPPPLVDAPLLSLDDFTIPTVIELYQQLDDKEPVLVHAETFTPGEITPPTPVCGAHSHWNGEKCECDPGYHDLDGVCVPNDVIPPDDKILWDSNKDGGWNNGKERIVKGSEGNIKANGKGIFTAASGSPEVHIDGKGTGVLVTKPGYGRFYICACNYNSMLEMEFNIMDSSVDNMSLKTRSRHQAGGSCENRFGGFGNAISTTEVDQKTESCHNFHENGNSQKLAKKLLVGEWYKTRYVCKDSDDGKSVNFTCQIDYNDGKGYVEVMRSAHKSPKPYYLDKGLFAKESWVWIRLNGSGSIGLKNIKLIAV